MSHIYAVSLEGASGKRGYIVSVEAVASERKKEDLSAITRVYGNPLAPPEAASHAASLVLSLFPSAPGHADGPTKDTPVEFTPWEVERAQFELPKLCALLTFRPDGAMRCIKAVSLKRAFLGQTSILRRFISLINDGGEWPHSDPINPTTGRDKKAIQFASDYFITVRTSPEQPTTNAVFRLQGIVTRNALVAPEKGLPRHIGLAPFEIGVPGVLELVRSVSNSRNVLVTSSNHGLMFSTGLPCDATTPEAYALRPHALDSEATVPIYDGRKEFASYDICEPFPMNKYLSLPLKDESFVEEGMASIVLFTAGFDKTTHPDVDADVIPKTLRLHIQAVIILADKNPGAPKDIIREFDTRVDIHEGVDPKLEEFLEKRASM